MRLKIPGMIVLLIVVIGIGIVAWRLLKRTDASRGEPGVSRPLRVGIVSWPGYAGGIVANNGFKPNKECIYWKNHKLLVEFLLMEDVDARAKAFANGDVDIVWSTVDFWAAELPGFIKDGVKARAIMQVDWSRGGDAIVTDPSISKIEDLRGKKVSLALLTPSHWLLEYNLQNSSLDETEQAQIVRNLVGKNASPDARADFVAGKVDAAVVWEPDVSEALQKRQGSRILVSTKTAANLIADLMVAREDFILKYPDVIKKFIEGWLDGTEEASRKPNLAAKLLMENEPLYNDLGEEATRAGLSTVKWADLVDNTMMFGLDGTEPLFDDIFRQASQAWVKRGYIREPALPSQAKDDRRLRELYASLSPEARPTAKQGAINVPHPTKEQEARPALVTKPVNIYFATGSAELDQNARQILDEQVKLLPQVYSNAYIRVEGNTDNTGNIQANVALSETRARAVVDYIVSRGLEPGRFIAKGNGPNRPVAANTTEAGRARNRRTDIEVVPR